MMKTPICDFVKQYAEKNPLRLHMPGHKGESALGYESFDITEIDGADSLYAASGIIAESEKNASTLFGANTFYSAEGSSLGIRAALYLIKLWGKDPLILAGRNAHKAFISAVAMLDVETDWLYPSENKAYLSCSIDLSVLEEKLKSNVHRRIAVYITSPDYLGQTADIKKISELCRKYNAILFVDNAHGAYLKFLPESMHPIDLGADICCDSAHKTLPVITGGAYLHISKSAPAIFTEQAKNALALFGSTSPSYLILQSLDNANAYIADGYREKTAEFIKCIDNAKKELLANGYSVIGNEPYKIVISAKEYGYYGDELAKILYESNIVCEFADIDHTVMMLTPENGKSALDKLVSVLKSIPKKAAITDAIPSFTPPKRAVSPRDAVFAESEIIDISKSEGRVLAEFNIACPPAVPIIVCGEVIDKSAIMCFKYYKIDKCRVIKR